MLTPPVTIPVPFVNGMLGGLEGSGVSRESLLAEVGIASEVLLEASGRVTADQYVTLFRLLMDRLRDEALGFLSRPLKPGSFALIARSSLSARTLESAISRVSRSFEVLQDDFVLEQVREHDLAGVALRSKSSRDAHPPFVHELFVRVFWRLLAWLVGGRLPAVRFDFAFEAPDYAASYGKVFPADLRFGQDYSAFWFDVAHLKDPGRRDEGAMWAFLADAQAYVVLPRRNDDVATARVRRFLQEAQPAWPDLEVAADALHMSTSTLQRHLRGEGISFQAVKDELRRDIAIVRLNTSAVPISALADDLGFSDSAAFQRAFKGWTGSAPGTYRRNASAIK